MWTFAAGKSNSRQNWSLPMAVASDGGLYVPEAWVTPAEIGVEAVTSIYVSMGLTSPQYLPRADALKA